MDERARIDNNQISKDLSGRYLMIILTSFFTILCSGTLVFVATSLFKEEFFMLKIAFLSAFAVYAFLKVFASVGVIFSIKSKKFTVELDRITDVEHSVPAFIFVPDFVYARRYKRYMEKVTFENTKTVYADKDEIGYTTKGDLCYIVKIRVLGKEQILSFYPERSYYYIGD